MIKQENYSIVCDIFMQIFECVKYLHSKNTAIFTEILNMTMLCYLIEFTVILNEFGISTYPEYNIHQTL
jgi:hypothetical protein